MRTNLEILQELKDRLEMRYAFEQELVRDYIYKNDEQARLDYKRNLAIEVELMSLIAFIEREEEDEPTN